MLEPVLLYYLNHYLGRYVEGLDRDSLRVSVWAGDVVLKDLKLRPEALQGLNLPITVRGGVLGTLRLKVCAGRRTVACTSVALRHARRYIASLWPMYTHTTMCLLMLIRARRATRRMCS